MVAVPTLFLVVTVAFFMMRVAPGSPFEGNRKLTPQIEAAVNAKYGLDRPLPVQFAKYVGDALHADLGPSLKYRDKTVVAIIAEGFPKSLTIGLSAILGPYLAHYRYDQVNKEDVWVGPLTGDHLLGTDSLGRDLLARLLIGLRVSLAVGVTATAVSLVIGTPVVSEYFQTGLVPRLPTAVLATGLMVSAFLSLTCGLILDTVTRGRWEAKRMAYLAIPGVQHLDDTPSAAPAHADTALPALGERRTQHLP